MLHATACGLLGGLVAVTAPAAWVAPWAAVVIGAIGGAIVVYGARFLERVLKLDDPVWAVAVHGTIRRLGLGLSRNLRRRHIRQPHNRRSPGDRPDLRPTRSSW